MQIVTEQQIAEVLNPEIAFLAVQDVFRGMESSAWNFPVVREALQYKDALFGFKSGFDPASGALGLKAGGYWPNNKSKGLANHQSSIFLFDPDTGQCKAMLAGNTITALRTAASSAISIDQFACERSAVLGLIGTGHQSIFQLEAALRVRSFEEVLVWNRSERDLTKHHQMTEAYGVRCREMELETVVRESHVIVTIASCFEPLFPSDWVSPGTHLAAMGTDTLGKQELDPALTARAIRFTDEIPQSRTIGEFQHLPSDSKVRTIGSVINGSAMGRSRDDEITVFDGTGVGLQDLACAEAVLKALSGS
ncbi:ornithine cyclodeaminase family protein [Litorivicinus sp.]|nr:ornithine cyclodeaminase family protein [Litorivicinus sp.]